MSQAELSNQCPECNDAPLQSHHPLLTSTSVPAPTALSAVSVSLCSLKGAERRWNCMFLCQCLSETHNSAFSMFPLLMLQACPFHLPVILHLSWWLGEVLMWSVGWLDWMVVCLFLSLISPVMDWRPIQDVPCHSPGGSWDRLQPSPSFSCTKFLKDYIGCHLAIFKHHSIEI